MDELDLVAKAWDLDFRQLNRGGFRGSLLHAGGPGLIISRTRLEGVLHQFGSSPPGLRTFAMSTHHAMDLCWRGHQMERNQILAYPSDGEHESISQPDFDMVLVSVPDDSLEAACRRLGIPRTEKLISDLEIATCDGAKLARLRRWIGRALATVTHQPGLLEDSDYTNSAILEASDLLVQAVVGDQADRQRIRSVRHRRLVDHAVRIARDDARRIHSVAELSRESGASPRTLRRGFRERFGVSPKAYLLAQRLVGCRRDLRNAGPEVLVTDVANSWGFWHMGQFAADYRAMFGELPSETLSHRLSD